MRQNFVAELRWRGLLHDMTPETEAFMLENTVSGYIGFDPTSDSLHIGSLIPIIILMHLQKTGHRPIALVGGATGMIGDPSGKSVERNLLDETTLQKNCAGIQSQLARFLDFDSQSENAALLVNNYDWMRQFSLIEFVRDIGKHLTVNYMMAKESVKKRISGENSEGMSFTEFTYQLIQGYDFLHLYTHHDCKLQLGGSDQWGNITTGTELIRRKVSGKAYAVTCPLITKADGTKFGKTEGGNVWLDKSKTSPYRFYQYWLNTSDEDAEDFVKKFTFLPQSEIEDLVSAHRAAPHLRQLQRTLAESVTALVHGDAEVQNAIAASDILFGKATKDALQSLDETTFLDLFEGVPQASISLHKLEDGLDMIAALAAETGFLKSNGEARRALQEGSIAVNKQKIDEAYQLSTTDLICESYVLLQRGKKNYFLLVVS